jgi:thiol-disulfide isomerase/thioredoxin
MRFLVVLGLLGALLLPNARALAQEKKADDELKIEGKLTADDPRDKVVKMSPHKVHEFKMKAGTTYVIEMKSKEFDPFLRLEDSKGKQLEINDDVSPTDLNSRIIHKAAMDDTYRIIATAFKGTGGYTLTVRKGTDKDLPFFELLGKKAPDLTSAFSFNGDTKKLSDLKGKVVLVDFWAVWCGPCIDTFGHLRDWSKEFQKDGLEIVGVTTYYERFGFDKDKGTLKKAENNLTPGEEHDMLKDFVGYHKLTHRIMTVSKEAWQKAGEAYSVQGIPHAVLIDRKGAIRMVRVGSGPENAAALQEEIRKLIAEK